MKNRFVIWGTGFRADMITDILGEDRISAYIDNDEEKQGGYFRGRQIIPFSEYLNNHSTEFIIVSPAFIRDEIKQQIEDAGIAHYFMLDMCPAEMCGYGEKDFWRYLMPFVKKSRRIVVYGENLFSYMFYERLETLGYDAELFCPDRKLLSELREKLGARAVSDIEVKKADIVLCATRSIKIEDIEKQFNHSVTDIFDMSDYIPHYYNPKLLHYKDIHAGEKCFIVATGPSLREEDLIKLKEKKMICFGVNGVFHIPDEVWLPDYYVFADRKGISDNWESVVHYPARTKFIEASMVKGETEGMEWVHTLCPDKYEQRPEFSEHMEKKIYSFATVVYAVLQIAVYMGFKEIYLLGVDCNYAGKKDKGQKSYFYGTPKNDPLNHFENQMVFAYETAKQYADREGIRIYNATRGGLLEVFERVDFDELMAKSGGVVLSVKQSISVYAGAISALLSRYTVGGSFDRSCAG